VVEVGPLKEAVGMVALEEVGLEIEVDMVEIGVDMVIEVDMEEGGEEVVTVVVVGMGGRMK
jgi:hypothetical protein